MTIISSPVAKFPVRSMSDAQNNYLTAHFNYQVSNLTLLKLTGQLDRLMK